MVQPNILITGTPGVGKSRICAALAKKLKYKWQDVSNIAKENNFVDEYDETLECPVLDEDKLLDYLEPEMAKGGNLVEYHCCELFPERWFQAVYVVQCNNTVLYDRLEKRGYNPTKLKQNIECEIFQECLNEANESYEEDIVHTLNGETEQDFRENIEIVTDFVTKYKN